MWILMAWSNAWSYFILCFSAVWQTWKTTTTKTRDQSEEVLLGQFENTYHTHTHRIDMKLTGFQQKSQNVLQGNPGISIVRTTSAEPLALSWDTWQHAIAAWCLQYRANHPQTGRALKVHIILSKTEIGSQDWGIYFQLICSQEFICHLCSVTAVCSKPASHGLSNIKNSGLQNFPSSQFLFCHF